jgi:hypothetical protein
MRLAVAPRRVHASAAVDDLRWQFAQASKIPSRHDRIISEDSSQLSSQQGLTILSHEIDPTK